MPKQRAATIRELGFFLSPRKLRLTVVFALAAVSASANLLGPFLIGYAIDHQLNNPDIPGLLTMLGALLAVYAILVLSTIGQNCLMIGVSQKTVGAIRSALFSQLLKLPIAFFSRRQQGELMSRLTNDVENISQTLNSSLIQIFTSIFTFVGMLGLMLWLSPVLTIITLAVIPVMVLGMKWITARTGKLFREQQTHLGELNAFIEETLSGQRIVTVYSREPKTLAAFRILNERYRKSAYWAQTYSGFISKLMILLNNLSFAVIAGAGGLLAMRDMVSVGIIVTFIEYARQFVRPLNDLSTQINTMLSAIAGAERVFDVIREEGEQDRGQAVHFKEVKGEIRFVNVSFSYRPEGGRTLNGIDFDVPAGKMLALVGSTGAGKSTVAGLLSRFYDVDEGRIELDGCDIRHLSRSSLRRHMGFVLQECFLFAGTIRDNIRYGRLDATDEEVEQASRLANVHDFIAKLPEGYDTRLSQDSSRISEGQKQLLSIARAILANPSVLVLDEATSSIDTVTELKIQDALSKFMRGRTCIVIAHRLNTIRRADKIIVLDQGRIVEQGTHESLLTLGGFYCRLHEVKQSG